MAVQFGKEVGARNDIHLVKQFVELDTPERVQYVEACEEVGLLRPWREHHEAEADGNPQLPEGADGSTDVIDRYGLSYPVEDSLAVGFDAHEDLTESCVSKTLEEVRMPYDGPNSNLDVEVETRQAFNDEICQTQRPIRSLRIRPDE